LAEDVVGGGIPGSAGDAGRAAADRERIIVFEHAVVIGVGNEDVAVRIKRNAGGTVEPVYAPAGSASGERKP
jgi:hypothetical protein